MKKIILIYFMICGLSVAKSQDMFPHIESASNLPKGVLGIRVYSEMYQEFAQFRNLQSVRFSLGLTSRWMITQSFNFSNHHNKSLPSDFIDNINNKQFQTSGVDKGKKYPYVFSNLNLNIKYRFLSIDEHKKYLRMAAYLEVAGGNQAHDETEPSLMGDNSGVAMGVMATKLENRFAFSASLGAIFPQNYYYHQNETSMSLAYGNALTYSMAAGWLYLPINYNDYKQLNINFYTELVGKAYQGATILNNEKEVTIVEAKGLTKGNYIEFRPSIQFVFNSNLKVDLSVSAPIVGRSYVRSYPAYYFSLQRNFYFK